MTIFIISGHNRDNNFLKKGDSLDNKFFNTYGILSIRGMLIGIINGLLGAGGGMLAVPFLTKSGLTQTKAHATSIAIIFPISLFSSILYLSAKQVYFQDAIFFMIWGILGTFIGVWLLPKISQKILQKLFSLISILAGFRLLFS